MSLVLEASVTLAWLNLDENTSEVSSVFDRLAKEAAWVPGLWWLEVANALQMGLRRKRYTREQHERYVDGLDHLAVKTDTVPVELTWKTADHL